MARLRGQPQRLAWPLTPSQVEALDEMLYELYKRVQTLTTTSTTVTTSTAVTPVATTIGPSGSMGLDGDDGALGMPLVGPTGPQGVSGIGIQGQSGDDGADGQLTGVPLVLPALTTGAILLAGPCGTLTGSAFIATPIGVVASTIEKAETGTDANVLTYTTGAADEVLVVQIAADVSALTGTSVAVTVTWKDSNNATATSTVTLTGVGDGTINIPINAFTATNVVVSTVFVGVSTTYKITAVITRLK